jgi:hypothetical protein
MPCIPQGKHENNKKDQTANAQIYAVLEHHLLINPVVDQSH